MGQSPPSRTRRYLNLILKYAFALAFILLMGFFIVLIDCGFKVTTPDLNIGIPLENTSSSTHDVWNDTDRVLYMSRVTNATSNFVESVSFWVNTSWFGNTVLVKFFYFNGTHGKHYDANESETIGSWNYLQWWTGYQIYWSDLFNTSIVNPLFDYTIPRQRGGTNVTYQLMIEVWNGTALEYPYYNGTFDVRYSVYEVEYERHIHNTAGRYCASIPVLIAVFVSAAAYLSSGSSSSGGGTNGGGGTPNPVTFDDEKRFLISRSDHLDGVKSNLRSGASLLMGISLGVVLWLGVLANFITIGLDLLAVFAFAAIIISFSSVEVENQGSSLERGLVPGEQSENTYITQLKGVIKNKQRVINQMESVIGIGLILLATSFIYGVIIVFFPPFEELLTRPPLMLFVFLAMMLAYLDGYLLAVCILGPRGLKLHPLSR